MCWHTILGQRSFSPILRFLQWHSISVQDLVVSFLLSDSDSTAKSRCESLTESVQFKICLHTRQMTVPSLHWKEQLPNTGLDSWTDLGGTEKRDSNCEVDQKISSLQTERRQDECHVSGIDKTNLVGTDSASSVKEWQEDVASQGREQEVTNKLRSEHRSIVHNFCGNTDNVHCGDERRYWTHGHRNNTWETRTFDLTFNLYCFVNFRLHSPNWWHRMNEGIMIPPAFLLASKNSSVVLCLSPDTAKYTPMASEITSERVKIK